MGTAHLSEPTQRRCCALPWPPVNELLLLHCFLEKANFHFGVLFSSALCMQRECAGCSWLQSLLWDPQHFQHPSTLSPLAGSFALKCKQLVFLADVTSCTDTCSRNAEPVWEYGLELNWPFMVSCPSVESYSSPCRSLLLSSGSLTPACSLSHSTWYPRAHAGGSVLCMALGPHLQASTGSLW